MVLADIVQLRHTLHSLPDLSNHESGTAEIISAFLKQTNPSSIIENIGGHGIAAIYEFPKPGKTVCIRCELDALPIEEEALMPYHSSKEGISHKCGHDGHMAIVSALGDWVGRADLEHGKVVLLFQPAEENGQGAKRIIKDEKFNRIGIDYIFALHNIPQEKLHSIIIMDKSFSAEVISFVIKLKGNTSHAAEPEKGINPALCISQLLTSLETLQVADPYKEEYAVLTPVHIELGNKSYGISPGEGEIHYTIRTWNKNHMDILKTKIKQIIHQTCDAHKTKYLLEWLEHFPASINNQENNALIRSAAGANQYKIFDRPFPLKFGEDFGTYAKHYKAGMFGIGAGLQTPPLHHVSYDFPDDIITTGVNMFKSIIEEILRK